DVVLDLRREDASPQPAAPAQRGLTRIALLTRALVDHPQRARGGIATRVDDVVVGDVGDRDAPAQENEPEQRRTDAPRPTNLAERAEHPGPPKSHSSSGRAVPEPAARQTPAVGPLAASFKPYAVPFVRGWA